MVLLSQLASTIFVTLITGSVMSTLVKPTGLPSLLNVDLDTLNLAELYDFQLKLERLAEDVQKRIKDSENLETSPESLETYSFLENNETYVSEDSNFLVHKVDRRSVTTDQQDANYSTVALPTTASSPSIAVQTQSQSSTPTEIPTTSHYTTETKTQSSATTVTTPEIQATSTSTSTTTHTPPLPQNRPVMKPTPRKSMNQSKEVECKRLSQEELVQQLKERGTYNPDFMAWDVPGVIRFLEKATTSTYDKEPEKRRQEDENLVIERNLAALERIMKELDVQCDLRSSDVLSKLHNFTASRNSPTEELDRLRTKRQAPSGKGLFDYYTRNKYLYHLYQSPSRDDVVKSESRDVTESVIERSVEAEERNKIIGQVHTVPFGCSKRGSEEEGYLRLCGACQAIRRLPDDFFPPFINEVLCDQDKACLYFYDYPHGKCKQKHMNFIVLRNLGSRDCQIWEKFNLNVRVSCECFVDEMSFFAKYV